MRKIIILFIACLPHLIYAQQWQQYSDSIFRITKVNQNKSDLDRAMKFVKLADNDIEKSKFNKDTIFADYLYQKGFVLYRIGELRPDIFEESLSIWEKSTKKNFLKIMKIHYFLAEVYNLKDDYVKAYTNYEKCYLLNKKYKLPKNTYFSSSAYCLSYIDYSNNINYKKAEDYANEYIEFDKESAYLNFDFNYAYAFRWKDDNKGYEEVLLKFKKNFEEENLSNPELYFNISVLLFTMYFDQFNINETIKYGEKLLELYDSYNMNDEKYLKFLYPRLLWAYSEINDNDNMKKYQGLIKK